MIISLQFEVDSLQPFTSAELPQLSIVIGKNGSGKSQLLEAIKKESAVVRDGPHTFNSNYIHKDDIAIGSISSEVHRDPPIYPGEYDVSDNWEAGNIHLYFIGVEPCNYLTHAQTLRKEDPYFAAISNLRMLERFGEAYGGLHEDEAFTKMIESTVSEEFVTRTIKIKEYQSWPQAKRNAFQLMRGRLSSSNQAPDSLFSADIGHIFSRYVTRRFFNSYYNFTNPDFGTLHAPKTDAEFVLENPPPWIQLNEVFEENNIDFKFDDIPLEAFNLYESLEVKLKKKSSNSYVNVEKLSSGEKIIIGLVSRIFLVNNTNGTISRPQLLLLDEPDAYLHPQMTKLMLEVLQTTFVDRLKIAVVLTTHSPTTVALADEVIFEMRNGSPTSLTKITKDEALKLLTGFLPTLTIDYKNHRQVFVESTNDIRYYQFLNDQHRQSKRLRHQLYFIASGAPGDGNCDRVKDIVESLRYSGNGTSYGIVDWDKSNKKRSEFVLVHGAGERYSIESFLLDPVYVMAYLLERNYYGVQRIFEIPAYFKENMIGQLDQKKLQELIDHFFSVLQEKLPGQYSSLGPKKLVDYYDGKKLQIPVKYLESQGHDIIIPQLKEAFSVFSEWHETQFREHFTSLVAQCYPFVPKPTIDLIEVLSGVD